MIRVYPSRHPDNVYPNTAQAIETHRIAGPMTVLEWLERNLPDFRLDVPQPITVDVDAETVEPDEWAIKVIHPEDDVRLFPVPRGIEAAVVAWVAVGIVAAGVLYALTLSTDTPDVAGSAAGDSLEVGGAKANTVRMYEPIRQLLGRDRIYPDYINQPVTRFVSGRDVRTSMLLCITAGRCLFNPNDLKIGNTPFSAFGSDVSYTIYEPGADVSADSRAQLWYVTLEVGNSKSATAGLNLDSPTSIQAVSADALALSGASATLVGDITSLPSSWVVGTIVNLEAPNNYQVNTVGSYSRIAGPLAELAPFVGMNVGLVAGTSDALELVVNSYSPYVSPVPGTGGSPSEVVASAAPSTYDFSTAPVAWSITYQSIVRNISLAADYTNMSGLVAEITSQLSGMGLVAQDFSGRLRIVEPSSPYKGGAISQSGAPTSLFGSPTYTTGTASTGGTPEQLAYITLEFEDGTAFAGLAEGVQRLTLGYSGFQYRIESVDGASLQLERLTDTGTIDASWSGFTARTIIDYDLSAIVTSPDDNWIGPFYACPEGELIDRFEFDMFFPGGLFHTNKKGGQQTYYSRVITEYTDPVTGDWVTIDKLYSGNTRDAFGKTESVILSTPGRPLVRQRRAPYRNWSNSQDTTQWLQLRGRLMNAPSFYPGVTLMALTVRTGDRLSAQSDRRVNGIFTRVYDEAGSRTINGAVREVIGSLPGAAVDIETLDDLQDTYWSPREETFDYSFTKQQTVIEVLRTILRAGMAEPTIEDSMISAIREGVQVTKGAITPHDQRSDLRVAFRAPSVSDDYSGVDVEYTDPATFVVETVQCRLPGLAPLKIEKLKLEGVQSEVRAWRIGMRQLMRHRLQRTSVRTSTEMDARVYRYKDRVLFTADIPGDQTVSVIIEQMTIAAGLARLDVSERLDWSFPSPRCIIRRQDGTVSALLTPSRVNDYSLTVPAAAIDWAVDWSPDVEPPRLIFCSSVEDGYSMMIDDIQPDDEGMCEVTGKAYSDELYQFDNASPTEA